MSEAALSRAIREAIALTGATVTRHQSGTLRVGGRTIRMGDPGWPDIVGYDREGRFVGIEVKVPKGRVEPHQAAWHEQARKAGCRVGVARSVREAVDIVTGKGTT